MLSQIQGHGKSTQLRTCPGDRIRTRKPTWFLSLKHFLTWAIWCFHAYLLWHWTYWPFGLYIVTKSLTMQAHWAQIIWKDSPVMQMTCKNYVTGQVWYQRCQLHSGTTGGSFRTFRGSCGWRILSGLYWSLSHHLQSCLLRANCRKWVNLSDIGLGIIFSNSTSQVMSG